MSKMRKNNAMSCALGVRELMQPQKAAFRANRGITFSCSQSPSLQMYKTRNLCYYKTRKLNSFYLYFGLLLIKIS